MLRCDPGLDPGEPRSIWLIRCVWLALRGSQKLAPQGEGVSAAHLPRPFDFLATGFFAAGFFATAFFTAAFFAVIFLAGACATLATRAITGAFTGAAIGAGATAGAGGGASTRLKLRCLL